MDKIYEDCKFCTLYIHFSLSFRSFSYNSKYSNSSSKSSFYFSLYLSRDWSPKFATGLNMIIDCSSKSIWVILLSFCQNDPLVGESFRQNNSLVTHILFELQPVTIFSSVANFAIQSLDIKYKYLGSLFYNRDWSKYQYSESLISQIKLC